MEHPQCRMRLPTGNRFAVWNELREIGLEPIHHAAQFLIRKLVLSIFLSFCFLRYAERENDFLSFSFFVYSFFPLASKLICMSGIEFTRRFDSKCSPRPSWHFFLLLSPRHPGQNARLKSDTLHNHGASITSREPLKTTRTQFQPHHRSSFIWDRIDTGEMILQLR